MFTTLDEGDLAAIAAWFPLGPLRAWRAIAAGTINSNFAVDTDTGRYFVRVNEGKTRDDVVWEGELAAHLAAGGVPTPVPLQGQDGARCHDHRGLFVSVFPWLPGHHPAPAEVTPDAARQLGAALAQIHRAGDRFPGPRRIGIYTWPHIRARFDGFRASTDPHLAHAIAVLGDELAVIDTHAAERAAVPQGVIHGDLFRDNTLFEDGRLTALLDFEQASAGAPVYDLAVALNDWCWTGRPHPELAAPLIDGYQTVRPLTPAERALLPVEIRAAAARFTVTRITDVYLPGRSNPDKDFSAFLARLEAWRGSGIRDLLPAI